jgi:hypothetical protein
LPNAVASVVTDASGNFHPATGTGLSTGVVKPPPTFSRRIFG